MKHRVYKPPVALEVPHRYKLQAVPFGIDFVVPGFERSYPRGSMKVLALSDRDSRNWYRDFVAAIRNAIGKQYLPICRIADGELLMMLGPQPPDYRLSWRSRMRQLLSRIKEHYLLKGGIGPFTAGHYHSGEFSAEEWRQCRREFPELVQTLGRSGIIAWHFVYTNAPFHEHFFPALQRWTQRHEVQITEANYYPFYFVYALLTGPSRHEIFAGRSVLVVNGAEGEKRERIIAGIKAQGVKTVHWCPISLKRSYFDQVDITPFIGRVDLALVGAGIGKLRILPQLAPLQVPCIDAGFVFETWANPDNRFKRVWCAADEDWAKVGSDPFSARI